MLWLQAAALPGILDLTPGIRSLQVHYDSRVLPLERLLGLLHTGEESLAAIEEMQIATRIVHLPLSWDDESTQLAMAKYMQSVRADAPWCPSNIEFIRRINGLDSVEDVRRIVFDATYVVLGLGDVYLGAPVTTPLDPRHRLVTTKYNPARMWTPENAVGIGGAYLCVYGMEGPGGYQFVGRTCQMWNTYKVTADFAAGKPWLLRFFDQIRFYPVSGAELLEFRADFLHGRARLDIRDRRFLPERIPAVSGGERRQHRRAQGASAGRIRIRARALGGNRPDRLRSGIARAVRRRGVAANRARLCGGGKSSIGQRLENLIGAGPACQGGRYAGVGGIDEDGAAGGQRRWTGSWRNSVARKAAPCSSRRPWWFCARAICERSPEALTGEIQCCVASIAWPEHWCCRHRSSSASKRRRCRRTQLLQCRLEHLRRLDALGFCRSQRDPKEMG